MPDNKLYEILGVSRGASDQEIKKVCLFNKKTKKDLFVLIYFLIGIS